ncbi:MAG: hypothetical protein B1H03_03145 [Planctomycetales bacterium 4484_113]|nr:MAG: hypothetical protein B1H03_03145 [Planctomycetales bacterium 4484_113]
MSEWLHSIPLYWAEVIGVLLFLAVIVFAWLMPREFVFGDALDQAGWRDLRIWATLICLIQIGLYLIFN